MWEAEIYSSMEGKDGWDPLKRLTGDITDILEWVDYDFYDLVWYWDNQISSNEPNIGRWLGVSHSMGSDLGYWLLAITGKVMSQTKL